MKLRNISTIISREYMTRVKKKSFLLTTFLVPVLFAAMCILPSVIMFMAKDKGKQVAVVDQSGMVMPYFVDSELVDYTDYSSESPEEMKNRFEELSLDVLVVISAIDPENKTVTVSSYSEKPLSMDLKEGISSKVSEAVEDYRISLYEMGDLKQILEDVQVEVVGYEKSKIFRVKKKFRMLLWVKVKKNEDKVCEVLKNYQVKAVVI